MNTQLNVSDQITYDAVLQHPVARNLEWLDVRSMLVAVADAVEQDSEVLRIRRNGRTLVLHRPYSKGMGDIADVLRVRRFLEQSSVASEAPGTQPLHLVVVIDDRRARVYRIKLKGSVPQRITPYHPSGMVRYLQNVQEDFDGGHTPEHKCFYESVAKMLFGAETILVLGSGTDATTPMRQLLIELGRDHQDVAKRIVGAIVVHEQHMTEKQMLARAREFYLPPVHTF
jgi:hypothetical protein